MKKVLFVLSMLFAVSMTMNANAYKLDEAAIETQFEAAEEFSTNAVMNLDELVTMNGAASISSEFGGCDPLVSFLLSTFVGYLGIHRLYMGTEPLIFVAYLLTAGGCGILYVVDWVMLLIGLIDDDVSKYCDNPKLFMWL